MFELERQESEFVQLIERLSVDDCPRGLHRESLRASVLAAYQEEASNPLPSLWQRTNRQGRAIMRRPITRYAAVLTAIALVFAGWTILREEQTASAAFYEFANSLVTAKSARFKMEVHIPGQPNMKAEATYLAPARFRQDMPDAINISDMAAGKIVSLHPKQKTANVITLVGRGELRGSIDLFSRLREALEGGSKADASLKAIGEKQINGRRALGFREESPAATLTVWGDPETGLPLQIETLMSGVPRTEVTWTDFELNLDLDESLFDTTPPAGYDVRKVELDASPYKESDLIETFRVASEINDGIFPDSIDTAASQQLIVKAVKAGMAVNAKQDFNEFMKLGAKIGRGFSFALQLPKSADAHYAGKGVLRDTKDMPVFWYRPEGAKKFRVIDADLTVHEAETAPEVAGAVRIGMPLEKAAKPAE